MHKRFIIYNANLIGSYLSIKEINYIILQLQLVAVESYLLILNHCKVLIKILQKKDYIHPQLGMKTRLIPIKYHTFIYYSKSLAINKILQQKAMI